MKTSLMQQWHFDFLATWIGEPGSVSEMSGCTVAGGAELDNAWRLVLILAGAICNIFNFIWYISTVS